MRLFLYLCLLIGSFKTFGAISISITDPTPNSSYPSSTSSITVKSAVSPAPGSTGTVTCNGQSATFAGGLFRRGFARPDAPGGVQNITCIYSKDGETAQATIAFNWTGNYRPIPT